MTREELRVELIRNRCTTHKEAPEMLEHIDQEMDWRLDEASHSRRAFMILPPGHMILERYKTPNGWAYNLKRM